MIALIYAHPYPHRSRANRALLAALSEVPELTTRSLYDLYPDFAIDVEAEQAVLSTASIVLWQCPLYWYSVPPLLKLWFDKVLAYGWAYGDDAAALRGKRCRWIVTTGGDDAAFSESGMHGHPFETFVAPIAQTARFCQMQWEAPFVVRGSHRIPPRELAARGRELREEILQLSAAVAQEQEHG